MSDAGTKGGPEPKPGKSDPNPLKRLPKEEHHTPEVIGDYIRRNYYGLQNHKEFSIGYFGGLYRVAVLDGRGYVIDTLKIDPRDIDADRKERLKNKTRPATAKARDEKRLDRARKTAAAFKAKQGRSADRDRER